MPTQTTRAVSDLTDLYRRETWMLQRERIIWHACMHMYTTDTPRSYTYTCMPWPQSHDYTHMHTTYICTDNNIVGTYCSMTCTHLPTKHECRRCRTLKCKDTYNTQNTTIQAGCRDVTFTNTNSFQPCFNLL